MALPSCRRWVCNLPEQVRGILRIGVRLSAMLILMYITWVRLRRRLPNTGWRSGPVHALLLLPEHRGAAPTGPEIRTESTARLRQLPAEGLLRRVQWSGELKKMFFTSETFYSKNSNANMYKVEMSTLSVKCASG